MILHIFESGRHAAAPKLWAGWSAAAHAAVVAGVVGGASVRPTEPPAPETPARYLLPRLPGAMPSGAAVERMQWVGLGGRPAPRGRAVPQQTAAAPPPAPPPAPPVTPPAGGSAPPPPEVPHIAADTGDAHTTPLYLAGQVEVEVVRDTSSEGPQYPDSLRMAGVEGSVMAEWVVDSAGRPDSATFRAIEATHPLFEAAVRKVLPRMRFHAATSRGVAVAQLVRQGFRFRISLAPDAAPGAAPTTPR